jgi:hypothetical protein
MYSIFSFLSSEQDTVLFSMMVQCMCLEEEMLLPETTKSTNWIYLQEYGLKLVTKET